MIGCTRSRSARTCRAILVAWLVVLAIPAAVAQSTEPAGSAKPGQPAGTTESDENKGFGGPDSVQNRIESDRVTSDALFDFDFLRPYYDLKEHIAKEYGYSYGLAYIATGLKATDSLGGGDDYAAGGVFRHFGAWELLGRGSENTGTLQYLVEYRNRYTKTSPSPFAFDNLGYVGAIEIPFANDGWHLTNLYWTQSFNSGAFEVVGGFLDLTDFVDVYPLTSPWTDFFNFAFSIGAGTMDVPDDAALGFAAGAWLGSHLYAMAGFEDLNSDPTDPCDGFNTFLNDHEFFSHVEIGWAGSKEAYYIDNLHLTLWHSDERDEIGVDDGWGAMLSFSHSLGDNWLVFARGGYSRRGGSLLHKAVSIGGGYSPSGRSDQLGFGAHWGEPNDDLFGAGLSDQYAIEAYYRLQVTKEIAITADAQLLVDPAFNPDRESILVFGLRARIAF